MLHNLLEGRFAGPILPVNPKYDELAGLKVHPTVASLPTVPELAVICTPPATVPGLIGELGACGTKAAVVITAGLGMTRDSQGKTLKEAMLAAAKPHLLRILGPNCVGLLVPGLGLNASFAHTGAVPGKIAFVSQSGALVTTVLDWAKSRGIGFSKFISLGDGADVDCGDVLDYLASDAETHAILLYIEGITAARKFMSAARAAARNKPVLVIKAGRAAEGARAAASHTGALAGSDDVYDAAIRRAGMLRVSSTEELFDAVETLARARPLTGDRLAIMTNGGGPGVMATDALMQGRGRLSELTQDTLRKLEAILPSTWSRGNPVDIIGDAPAARYVQTLQVLLEDSTVRRRLVHSRTDGDCGECGNRNRRRARAPEVDPEHARMLAGRGCGEGGARCLRASRHSHLRHARRGGARISASRAISQQSGLADGGSSDAIERVRARSGEGAGEW